MPSPTILDRLKEYESKGFLWLGKVAEELQRLQKENDDLKNVFSQCLYCGRYSTTTHCPYCEDDLEDASCGKENQHAQSKSTGKK